MDGMGDGRYLYGVGCVMGLLLGVEEGEARGG